MRADDGSPPDRRTARQRLDRVRSAVLSAPLPVKIVLVLALLAVAVLASAVPARVGDLVVVLVLCYGPVAIWRRQRSVIASLGVAAWGEAAILAVAATTNSVTLWIVPLLLLPFAVVAAAHSPPLSRNLVPCRTVAWTLLWSVPPALLAWRFASSQPVFSYVIGWLIAAVVLGWRLTRSWQEGRIYGRQPARSASVAGPHGETTGHTTPPTVTGRPGRPPAGLVRAVRDADGSRMQQVAVGVPDRPVPERDLPTITVEQAMAEL